MKKNVLSLIVIVLIFFCSCEKGGYCLALLPAEASAAVSPAEITELKYLHLINLSNEEKFITEYNETNPHGIKIVTEQADFAELDKRILIAAHANNAYDIILTNHSSVSQFVSLGLLEQLDSYISSSEIDLAAYQMEAVNIGRVGGVQMAIPYNPDCRVLAINTKVFAKAGLSEKDYPNNIIELLEVSRKIRDADGSLYSFAPIYFRNWFPVYDFGSFMLGNGGRLYVEENGSFKATVNSQAVIDFVKWSQELFPTMVRDFNISEEMARELFMQDKTAFLVFGPWEFEWFAERVKNGEIVLTLMPSGSIKSGSAMGGWMLSIAASSKKKEYAWQFISEVNKPENMAKFCQALPANTEAFKYPPFNDPMYAIFSEQFKTAEYPASPISIYSQIADIFHKYYLKAITGGMTAEEACGEAQNEIHRELDNI